MIIQGWTRLAAEAWSAMTLRLLELGTNIRNEADDVRIHLESAMSIDTCRLSADQQY